MHQYLGSAYQILAYQPAFAHIGIKYFVTNMADNVLLMYTPIIVCVDQFYCHVLIVHCLFVNHFRECFDDVKEEIVYWGLL